MLREEWESIGKEVGEGKEWQMNANEGVQKGSQREREGCLLQLVTMKFYYSLLSPVLLPPSPGG